MPLGYKPSTKVHRSSLSYVFSNPTWFGPASSPLLLWIRGQGLLGDVSCWFSEHAPNPSPPSTNMTAVLNNDVSQLDMF
jgi:hypothetical protein